MEGFMLEDYYVKPATVDRVRASWLAPQIESYLEWLESPTEVHHLPDHTRYCPSAAGGIEFLSFGSATGLQKLNFRVADYSSRKRTC